MLLTDSRSCQATDATAVVAFVASIVSSVTRKGALLTTDEFRRSLAGPQPPPGLSPALLALWHDGRGDWDDAHSVAQEVHSRDGSRVHAYLHRREGEHVKVPKLRGHPHEPLGVEGRAHLRDGG